MGAVICIIEMISCHIRFRILFPLYDYAAGSFGFTKGNLNALRENKRESLGAGEFIYRETLGKTVYLDVNAAYWLGAANVPEAILTIE